MNATIFDRRHFEVSFDRQAWYLVGLFLFVQGAAAWLAFAATSGGADVEPPGGVDGPAAGAGLAIAEVAVAMVFIGAILAFFKLPEWLREHIKDIAKFAIIYSMGAYAAALGGFLPVLIGAIIGYTVAEADLWWIVNNVLSVMIAIAGAMLLGMAFNEWMLVVFIIGMAVYDRLFADKREYMFQMAGVLVKARLPVLFVKPSVWRFDWDDIFGSDGEDDEDEEDGDGEVDILDSGTSWGIGTADLMLPAAVVASVATSDTLAFPAVAAVAVAAAVGVSALRIRQKMIDHESGAGLPPIAAGTVAAYAIAVVPMTVYGVIA